MNFVDFLGAPAFDPYDTSQAVAEGRYKDAIVPGISAAAPFLGKPTKLLADAIRRRHSLGQVTDSMTTKPISEFGPNYGLTEPTQDSAKHALDQNTPVASQMPSSPDDAGDALEAKFTKSGEAAFKPTLFKPTILRPHVLRGMADPYDIDFRIPRKPGKRSSPWVAQYPPILRPPRPFRLDYPNGALTNADGFLLFDMENRLLTAKIIAGRRKSNEPDYPLTPDDVTSIIYKDAGVEIAPARRPNELAPGTIGQLSKYPDGRWAEINFWNELPGDQADVTIAHEFGHLLEEIAGKISTKEIDDELIPLYSAHSTGRIGPPFLLPENRGYRGDKPQRERAAEAFRIYATGPNTMKSMAPKTAAAIRTLNTHPFFSKFIQFNGIPIGVTTGAAATAAGLGTMGPSNESNVAEAPAQQNSETNLREGIGPMLGPSAPLGLANRASSQLLRNEKLGNLARILVDLEAKKKPQFYGGPR